VAEESDAWILGQRPQSPLDRGWLDVVDDDRDGEVGVLVPQRRGDRAFDRTPGVVHGDDDVDAAPVRHLDDASA
jgi:hypothetical protein